jgi:hypothetical protein
MFKQLGYEVKYVGTVFPGDFTTKELEFIFKDTELDENVNKQIDYKKEQSDKIKKNKEENKIKTMNSISESIIKTFNYYYREAGKEEIDGEMIDVFKEIITKNYTDKTFCARIANIYTENVEEKKELAKKIENTIIFFKNGFNDVVITNDIVKIFNDSLKIPELNANELNQIRKLYTDSKSIKEQKEMKIIIKLTNSRLEGNMEEVRKINEKLLGINLFDGSDFKSIVPIAESCSIFMKMYNENLNNNELMRKYNGMYFNEKYMDKYFSVMNCMCKLLVGTPEIKNGSSRLKLVKDTLPNRKLYGENLFEPKTNDYRGAMSIDSDSNKKSIVLIRILRILASNNTHGDFVEDINILKTEGVDYLKSQIESIKEKRKKMDKNDKINMKKQTEIIKKLNIKIEYIKNYEVNYKLIKKIIRLFNKHILNKYGKEISLDNKNRVYGEIAQNIKNGDRVFRLKDKIKQSLIIIHDYNFL